MGIGRNLQRRPGTEPEGAWCGNLALLRKLALNLALLEPGKGSMRGKLKRAGWDDNFLITILSQFAKIHMR